LNFENCLFASDEEDYALLENCGGCHEALVVEVNWPSFNFGLILNFFGSDQVPIVNFAIEKPQITMINHRFKLAFDGFHLGVGEWLISTK
jgi:hypothetical protein